MLASGQARSHRYGSQLCTLSRRELQCVDQKGEREMLRGLAQPAFERANRFDAQPRMFGKRFL
ncbi:MAG: hypothetical protein NVS4B5_08770 [Vulcanimicrobiaceae bacterium]